MESIQKASRPQGYDQEQDIVTHNEEESSFVDKTPRYKGRERKVSKRFTLNSLCKGGNENELTTQHALEGNESKTCWKFMIKELETLQHIDCGSVFSTYMHRKLLNAKFVHMKKGEKWGKVVRHKARVIVRHNEEEHAEEDRFSSSGSFTIVMLIMSLSSQKGMGSETFRRTKCVCKWKIKTAHLCVTAKSL